MTTGGVPMRIAFDIASNWESRGGVWRYGLELARALGQLLPTGSVRIPCFDLLPPERLAELRATGASVGNNPVLRRVDRLDAMSKTTGRFVPWSRVLPAVYRPWMRDRLIASGLGACDLYHGVYACRGRPRGAAVVGTIQDMLPVVYPELCGISPEFQHRMVETHRRWADLVIVPSAATRDDVTRLTRIPADRIRTVHHGIDHAQFHTRAPVPADLLARHGLTPGRFFLYVGSIERRKNIDRMVRAYLQATPAAADVPLVISGAPVHDIPALRDAEASGDRRVRVIGYAGDADLAGLYAAARALIHVAFVEGFGFTPLEAMACGTPAIVSAIGSSAEVVGAAGLAVDPHDEGAIAAAIRALGSDDALHRQLTATGLTRAREFTWEACARQTLAVYAEAIEMSRGEHCE